MSRMIIADIVQYYSRERMRRTRKTKCHDLKKTPRNTNAHATLIGTKGPTIVRNPHADIIYMGGLPKYNRTAT